MESKKKVIISLCIVALFTLIYSWYVASMTENHSIETPEYLIDLSISKDETFLDSQDDYCFTFSPKSDLKRTTTLEIDDCLSRCWVLSKNQNNSELIMLSGCGDNDDKAFLFNLNTSTTSRLNTKLDGYVLIDTLTNLYVDEQLPMDYHY